MRHTAARREGGSQQQHKQMWVSPPSHIVGSTTARSLSATSEDFPTGIDGGLNTPNPPGARTGGAQIETAMEPEASGRNTSSQRMGGAINPQKNCHSKAEAIPLDGLFVS